MRGTIFAVCAGVGGVLRGQQQNSSCTNATTVAGPVPVSAAGDVTGDAAALVGRPVAHAHSRLDTIKAMAVIARRCFMSASSSRGRGCYCFQTNPDLSPDKESSLMVVRTCGEALAGSRGRIMSRLMLTDPPGA